VRSAEEKFQAKSAGPEGEVMAVNGGRTTAFGGSGEEDLLRRSASEGLEGSSGPVSEVARGRGELLLF
jgi:hypothetical protein